MEPKVKKLVTPEEILAHDITSAVGFVSSVDIDERLKKYQETTDKPRRDDLWGAMDENGDICATMTNNLYSVEFDGHIVAAGGVGGVSSLPEFRSKGGIRAIFREQFRDMYQKGFLLSYLFPFSHPYYRQFGYELCCTQASWQIEIDAFKPFSCTMDVYMCRKDDPLDDLKAVHAEFIKGKNLAIHRRDDQWWAANGDPFKDRVYKYVFCGEDGLPRAYVIFTPKKTEGQDGYLADVRDLAYLTPDDLRQIFGFFYRLRAQYRAVRLELPADVPVSAMITEPYECRHLVSPHGQMRIICVQKALELMHYPEEAGQFTVEVSDGFLPENNRGYAISFADGQALSVEKTQEAPDLSVTIQRFSQLAVGFVELGQTEYLSDVTLHGNRDVLEKVFVRKPLFFTDHF